MLILYINDGTYNLKSTPNDRIFSETFHGSLYLLSQFLPEICWDKIAAEIIFVICFDIWTGARTLAFTCNKLTHYLLNNGDFRTFILSVGCNTENLLKVTLKFTLAKEVAVV